MESKVKKGMYARTDKGIITKVLSDWYEFKDGETIDLEELDYWYDDIEIVNASFNKIDLIEENDVIVIRLHGNLYKHEVSRLGGISDLGISLQIMDNIVFKTLEELTIISVLTHEQFKANEYIFED